MSTASSIQCVSVSDIPSIISMLQVLRTESPTYNIVDDDPEYVSNNLSNILLSGSVYGVIYTGRGFMLGSVGSTWYSSKRVAEEMILYVAPEFRGSSLAMRLIKAFENQTVIRGATSLSVGASTGMNDSRTEQLYERLGYSRRGHSLTKEFKQCVPD